MATNLKDFCKNIADSIRAKEGSTDLISPMDFAQRIDNLQVGGGESSWKYYRCTSSSAYSTYFIGAYSIVRMENSQLPHAIFVDSGTLHHMSQQGSVAFDSAVAMAVNMDMRVTNMQTLELTTVGELFGESINQLTTTGEMTEITKEQFYDLNA